MKSRKTNHEAHGNGEDRKLYTQLGGWKWQKLIALQRTDAEEQRKPRFLEEVPHWMVTSTSENGEYELDKRLCEVDELSFKS